MPVDNREDYSKPRALVISEIPGTVNPFHLVTRNDMAAGAGFSNMAHCYTISACKVGGQRAADLTLVWPKLGRSGLDLPDLSATHCRSWLDLTIWNKIQDHTAPRQQIERNRQRLRRGRTVSDMQKNHCRFGSDPYDLVHIQAQSRWLRTSLPSSTQIWSSFSRAQRLNRGSIEPSKADPCGDKTFLRQKFSPRLRNPLSQEMEDSKNSGPKLLQKSSKDSSAPFQIQIAQISGKTLMQWVNATDLVQNLKANLEHRLGIPSALQRLIFQGKQLEDSLPLSSYSIKSNNSLVFSFRLRGGAAGQSSSAPPNSYKAAVRPEKPAAPEPPKPKPFLVDKLEEVPSVEISYPDLADDSQNFAERAIICRFNGIWPRSQDLHDWIKENWTDRCKVYFCAKGYFIVLFDDLEHCYNALDEGPWFMGSAGLFLTPWFPDFDPASAIITKAPVWIRLPNLPVHLWRTEAYRQIGNALGRFLTGDYTRQRQGLYTYARVCVELDLSKGLPEHINLKIKDSVWTQYIEYENTAFRCRHCHLTGHLHSSCPSLSARKKRDLFAHSKPKRWAPCPPPPAGNTSPPSMDKEEIESEPDQMPQPMDPSLINMGLTHVTASSQKRPHEPSSSESEKESPETEEPSLQVVLAHPPHDGWTKVNKKKGKKHCGAVSDPLG